MSDPEEMSAKEQAAARKALGVGCKSEDCTKDAEHTVFWPGKTTRMCTACKDRALRVAEGMGFALDVRSDAHY